MSPRLSDSALATLRAHLHDPVHPLSGWDAFTALVDELVERRASMQDCPNCSARPRGR